MDEQTKTAYINYVQGKYTTDQTDILCRIEQMFWLYQEPLRSIKINEIEERYKGR